MTIETKFNIGDKVYYGDETICYDGKIYDIKISFFGGSAIIMYVVDTNIISEKDRYKDFDEGRLYSSPDELLKMQIRRYEKQIEHLREKIIELKKKIK
jgi:hypothetical protein